MICHYTPCDLNFYYSLKKNTHSTSYAQYHTLVYWENKHEYREDDDFKYVLAKVCLNEVLLCLTLNMQLIRKLG